MKREESLERIIELTQSQDFNPLWKFIIPAIKNIIDDYYKNSESKCFVEITDYEKNQYNLDLQLCINITREILGDVDIKCNLILLEGNNLKVFFSKKTL